MKKPTLEELAHNTSWVAIQTMRNRHNSKINESQIGYTVTTHGVAKKHVNILFGRKIAKEPGFNTGDKIHVFHHPDDVMSLCLAKSTSGNGYTIGKRLHSKENILGMSFLWKLFPVVEKMSLTVANFIHIKKSNQIVFRIDV